MPPQRKAIVTVGTVHAGSPAAEAGLREGDSILAMGEVDSSAFASIEQSLVPLIKASAGSSLAVEVVRVTTSSTTHVEELRLNLRPRSWSGNGLVGCVLHPAY
mmetsp:Transcript_4022/g.11406  ORF Transcript_4022/g.11406 Transcript_4022/m.11406 type:complete len:103 (+) Transcript_4022:3-311(+)